MTLYQSQYFVDDLPLENKNIKNVTYIKALISGREASLTQIILGNTDVLRNAH